MPGHVEKEKLIKILQGDGKGFQGLQHVELPHLVSYSRNVFIPLSNACRNACRYCGFRSEEPYILSRKKVKAILEKGRRFGCKEALFTFGERPEAVEEVKEKLKGWGYQDIIEYLRDLCQDAIDMDLLPHSNPGVLEYDEMKGLKGLNASMGLMLESSSPRLCQEGMPHENSPGKVPEVRIRAIENAGRLKIPFTTGLLIGIGETSHEIADSLMTIYKIQKRYNNIQEIIIQNFVPKKNSPMARSREPSIFKMLKVVRAAREMMPEIPIQVPPNLNPHTYQVFILNGVSDLGGISPVTKDYVNPESSWPLEKLLKTHMEEMGLGAVERLPIYPEFIKKGWYSQEIGDLISRFVDESGYVRGV